jgi:sigma-B regulation protein RsbU (phosphoserine phosphatase)
VFITAILGTIDTRTGLIEYVGAGHPCPLLLGGREIRAADDRNSLPLGINPDESYEVTRIEPTGELAAVLFYTDGLIEAADHDGRILGLEPITQAVSSLQEYLPTTVIRTARSVVRDHLDGLANADDMTLLAIRVG